MTSVELPRKKAEKILRNTMARAGYKGEALDVGVWSAIWLQERGPFGIDNFIIYLLMIRDLNFDELRPFRHPEFNLGGICPFMLADVVIQMSDSWLPRGAISFGAPASPLLMMASICDWASYKGKSVRYIHRHHSCLMSEKGIELESDDLGVFLKVDPDPSRDRCDLIHVEITDEIPKPFFPFGPVETIKLPSNRLRGTAALDFS